MKRLIRRLMLVLPYMGLALPAALCVACALRFPSYWVIAVVVTQVVWAISPLVIEESQVNGAFLFYMAGSFILGFVCYPTANYLFKLLIGVGSLCFFPILAIVTVIILATISGLDSPKLRSDQ